MDTENNQLTLCGVIESAPVLDHEVFGEQFYRMDVRAWMLRMLDQWKEAQPWKSC